MNKFPKISIITPVYNRIQYLESTIQSVLSQGYPNLEYIIIDGGSTDGSVDLIKSYANKQQATSNKQLISYWQSEPDEGMYYALQKGFDRATGDILAWLNSDDLYHQNSLFVVADIFSTLQNVEWITGIPSIFNKNGECSKVSSINKWSKHRILAGDFRWIQQESTFFRKEIWEKVGAEINTDYNLAADFELWTRFFDQATLYSVNTVLSGFRMHGNQLSLINNTAYEDEAKEIYKSYINRSKSGYNKIIRFFYSLSSKLKKSKYIVFKLLYMTLTIILKKTYKLPKTIYYDFKNNKWEL